MAPFTMNFFGLTGLFKDALSYPGEFGSDTQEDVKESESLYVSRMDLWLSSRKKLAATVLQGALRGLRTRKETPIRFMKETFMLQAQERVESRKAETEKLQDRIRELEEENAILKQLHKQATNRYFHAIQKNVEDLQHRRQVHHLRKKIDST